MHGLSRAQTEALVRETFAELSMVAGWTWKQTHDYATVRIEIRGNDSVMYTSTNSKGQKLYAFGKAWRSGRVALNADRKVNFYSRRVMQWLLSHEVMHVFGWNHGPTGCVMDPNRVATFWCPGEIRKLQNQQGRPEKPFHPIDRIQAGNAIRATRERLRVLKIEWSLLVAERTRIVERGDWLKHRDTMQPAILRLVDKMRSAWGTLQTQSREWHRINDRWAGVPSVVQVGK